MPDDLPADPAPAVIIKPKQPPQLDVAVDVSLSCSQPVLTLLTLQRRGGQDGKLSPSLVGQIVAQPYDPNAQKVDGAMNILSASDLAALGDALELAGRPALNDALAALQIALADICNNGVPSSPERKWSLIKNF